METGAEAAGIESPGALTGGQGRERTRPGSVHDVDIRCRGHGRGGRSRGAPGALLVIISGPSGVGKDTIIAALAAAPAGPATTTTS